MFYVRSHQSVHRLGRNLALAATLLAVPPVHSQQLAMFSGTTRLACEALLCLSSSAGNATSACSPALSHYFGISGKDLSDTLDMRLSFLQQCPASSHSPAMSSLVRAISQGAGRCDAASLNATLKIWGMSAVFGGKVMISSKMPDYCKAYTQHQYTDLQQQRPRYVGTVKDGGYWVPANHYEEELARYQEELKLAKEQRKRGQYSNQE